MLCDIRLVSVVEFAELFLSHLSREYDDVVNVRLLIYNYSKCLKATLPVEEKSITSCLDLFVTVLGSILTDKAFAAPV